jgi:hypothetical protein
MCDDSKKQKNGIFNPEKYFEMLEDWKQLPDYQLERRVDSFIGYYLKPFLSKHLNTNIDLIIPEFPLKQESSSHSDKVDFAVFSKEDNYLIELKTDINSINKYQLCYLQNTSGMNIKDILGGIMEIFDKPKAPASWKKYQYLLHKLTKINLLSEKEPTGHRKRKIFDFTDNTILSKNFKVLFILPAKTKDIISHIEEYFEDKYQIIEFSEIAKWLRAENSKQNSFVNAFATSLDNWTKPKTINENSRQDAVCCSHESAQNRPFREPSVSAA